MTILCQHDAGKCSQCGHPMQPNWRRTCGDKRVLGKAPQQRPATPEGLGDWLENQLKKLGVTEERWGEAKAIVGLDPSCNCASRKAWLNKVSAWWRGEQPADDPTRGG